MDWLGGGRLRRGKGLLCVFVTTLLVVALAAGCDPGGASRGSGSKAPSASHTSTKPAAAGVLFNDGVERYRISVTALYRSGPFMRLGFKLTCVKDAGDNAAHACAPDEDFGTDPNDQTYGGFYLVDSVRHREYSPVQSKDGGDPFTAQADYVDKGKAADGWVVFPAADKSARSLDVVVPHGPALENVSIGKPRPKTQHAATQQNFDKPKDTKDTSGLELSTHELRLHTTSEAADENQEKGRKNITLSSDVLFAFDKAELTGKAKTVLDRVATGMDEKATGTVSVTGYTDSKGTPKVNVPLSKRRAKAVTNYLKGKAKRNRSYSVTGKGEADPIASNTKSDGSDNPKGRAKNRRVTVSYKVQPASKASSTPSRAATQTPKSPKAISWSVEGPEVKGEDTYRVAIQRVRRHGDVAALHLTMTCKRPGDTDLGCRPQNELQDKDHSGVLAPDRAGGFRLYQAPTKTRYYPVIEAGIDARAWTSDTAAGLKPGREQPYWVYFPAPDPGVSAVDVELPGGGPTVHDVPLA